MVTSSTPQPSFSVWLADRLREQRLEVREFTRLSGFTRHTIDLWLQGGQVPSQRSAQAIARALSVPVSDVLALLETGPESACPRCLWEEGRPGGDEDSAHTRSLGCQLGSGS